MCVVFTFLAFLGLFAAIQDSMGCDVKIEITPERTVGLLEEPVNISCDVVVNVKEIMLMSISKDENEPIVIMRQGSNNVLFGAKNVQHIQAEGRTDKNSSRKYLGLTLLQPKREESGTYICTAMYIDEKFAIRHSKASANLTVEVDLDNKRLEIVLTHILARLSNLEWDDKKLWQGINKLSDADSVVMGKIMALNKENRNQSEQISDLKENGIAVHENMTKQTVQLQDLQTNGSYHSDAIDSVEKTAKNLRNNISELKKKASYKSAFSATLTSNLRLYSGQVVKFPNVQMSEGSDYHRHTGVYTAPVKGVYAFHFSFGLRDGGDGAYISIRKNNVKMVTTHAFEDGHDDHSACSTVVSLVPGDRVMVVVDSIYASSTHMEHYHRLSVFSGCLVQPL